jgi:hypothetical protein
MIWSGEFSKNCRNQNANTIDKILSKFSWMF